MIDPYDVSGALVEVRGDFDEDGFHLILETDDERMNLRVSSTEVGRALLREVNRLRPWIEEEARERAAYDAASPEERAHVLRTTPNGLVAMDPETHRALHEGRDPHEAMRDRADIERKRAKGE